MDYHTHLSKFIEKAATVDYYLTGLILHRFFPDFKQSQNQLSEEFLDFFVRDRENGITFGRKITLFTKIAVKNYADSYKSYPHLSKSILKSINNHRNTLAHSFVDTNASKDAIKKKEFILISFTPDENNVRKNLPFDKCKDMEKTIQETINEMARFYKTNGII
ncbi:MAG: hypothetical protein FD123_949 [Bacteroidetes bacterium]|nr:MAG: hypothetical protein FD123_949 [Bacteroidota bacterium]